MILKKQRVVDRIILIRTRLMRGEDEIDACGGCKYSPGNCFGDVREACIIKGYVPILDTHYTYIPR